jgi:uncharacterized membrane protein
MAEHVVPTSAKEALSKEALDRIAAVIAEVELSTSAEIRVSIREEREPHEHETIEELAYKEFSRLRMQETKDRSGILLFILFEDRKYYIYGDEGVHRRSEPHTWDEIATSLHEYFRKGDFEGGIISALHLIKERVHTAMPRMHDDTDELSNEVTIG